MTMRAGRHEAASPGEAGRRPPTWHHLILLGVLALAAAVRLHWIGLGSLDIDEAFTVWVARHPVAGIWSVLARLDDHPPLYYVMLHWWIHIFGDGVVALRVPSVLSGLLTVVLAYRLGRMVGGGPLGLLTAFLIALAPDLVTWSQEARMYALETLGLAAAMVALARLLVVGGRSRAAWAAYVGGTVAAMWTDYTAALFPVAVLVALAWVAWTLPRRDRPAFARRWLGAHLAVAALCVPELFLLVRQVEGGTVVQWYALNPYAPAATAAVGIVLVLLGRAIWRHQPQWVALTTALWVVPIACLIAVSLVGPVFVKRAYLWTDVPLALAIAAGLGRIRLPWVRAGLVAMVAAVAVVGVYAHYRDDVAGDVLRGWDRAAAYVAARAAPGDLVLFYVPYVQPAFDYYFAPLHPGVDERGVPADFGASRTLFPPLADADAARVPALVAGHRRVWLVHGMYPSARVILDALDGEGRLVDSRTVTDALKIYLYETRRRRGGHRPASWTGRRGAGRGGEGVLRAYAPK
ncbi:MAG TPA: glycosyltransferase family 39 protein [bacterium]|nr:glycosyltransferase family 39 protein [bacterium]